MRRDSARGASAPYFIHSLNKLGAKKTAVKATLFSFLQMCKIKEVLFYSFLSYHPLSSG
jgi:hypothetical protein